MSLLPNRASASETIAAEDVLHDLGAFSMISSDTQAMGRVGEVLIRTWQTAAQDEEAARPPFRGDSARTTMCASSATSPNTPSIRPSRRAFRAHVGSVEAGKRADLVLWSPAFFGVKPDLVLQGRHRSAARDGRSQCLDSDAPAGALPPHVRGASAPRAGTAA